MFQTWSTNFCHCLLWKICNGKRGPWKPEEKLTQIAAMRDNNSPHFIWRWRNSLETFWTRGLRIICLFSMMSSWRQNVSVQRAYQWNKSLQFTNFVFFNLQKFRRHLWHARTAQRLQSIVRPEVTSDQHAKHFSFWTSILFFEQNATFMSKKGTQNSSQPPKLATHTHEHNA